MAFFYDYFLVSKQLKISLTEGYYARLAYCQKYNASKAMMTKIISAIGGLRFFLSSQPQLQHPISHLHDKRYNH